MNQAKPFQIPKQVVWDAYKRVKANRGACGVDGMTIQELEKNLKGNLYKLWNRMSSGSYFPPPVRLVEIPKSDGRKRPLGIPTVLDRIAQMVVKMMIEPTLEPYFHSDSYGYRPKKSALEAIGKARERCWQYDWVLDIDIQGFFDNLSHELIMRALVKHIKTRWILLYIQRWLKAPLKESETTIKSRHKGTPQGGVISPLLANLFLHYAFDEWMKRNYSKVRWERYADDIVVHCRTEEEATRLKQGIEQRLAECDLRLNLQKTQVVYCKDTKRKEEYPGKKFNFLGYTFQPRRIKSRSGGCFTGFTPAIGHKQAKAIQSCIRQWKLHLRSGSDLQELADQINPVVRGWVHYYGSMGIRLTLVGTICSL